MAILAIFTGNINQSQYDALRKEVNWEQQQAQGGVFHAAGFDEAGNVHAADVWESPETLNAFVEQRLAPAMQKLQIAPPEVSVFPVHNINAFAEIEQYRI